MLHVTLRALGVVGAAAFVWFAWAELRYGSVLYDRLSDAERLIARTSFISLFCAP